MNIVRSIRKKSKENEIYSKRESNWDNRFHLGKLPSYNIYNDANCIYF